MSSYIHNFNNGITKSGNLLVGSTANTVQGIGAGASGIAIKEGLNQFAINVPVIFESHIYGVVNNNGVVPINARLDFQIQFDDIPLDKDWNAYFKATIIGDPNVTIYPQPAGYLSILWAFSAFQRDYIVPAQYEALNFQGQPLSQPTFTTNGDFYYFHFWKTIADAKLQYFKYPKNQIPIF